ncbi:MAG: hypothetical protein K2K93_07405 [Muribaculaceae bacterium]|nr:hypothetical protein [Muribaculaceae bacterium]
MKRMLRSLAIAVSAATALTCYADIAVLDLNKRNYELEHDGDFSRQVFSAQYMCDIAGYNYITTEDLETALQEDVVLLACCLKSTTFSREELEKINSWVKDGGVLVSPAIRSVSSSSADIIGELFGIDATQKFDKLNTRTAILWNPDFYNLPELEYIDEDEERETSIGSVKSFAIPQNGCDVLANYNTGGAAVVRNTLGKGKAYLVGISWRDVVQRNLLNKDQNSSRQYNNGFEPSSDVWALFLRSIHASASDLSVWKFTVPGGYTQILVPTHDCDSRTAYDEMHFMSEYEKSMGCKGHYFLTTHYYSDKVNFGHSYLSDFYNSTTIPKAKALLADGHTVGSHSVCHFPDFNKVKNTDVVTRDEYAHRATCEDGTSRGASTWAEIVMSKQIIEGDLNNHVRSFRSGHLCVNSDFHAMLEKGEYEFQSCYTGGDLLSEFPFFGRYDNTWDKDLSKVLTIPLHISDVYNNKEGQTPLNDDTWNTHPAPEQWFTAMKKLRGNYANAVLLIHPNREWKMILQKRLVEKLNPSEVIMYNFEDYGDFWLARHNCKFDYEFNPASATLVITTDTETALKNKMPFAVETSHNISNAVIKDAAGRSSIEGKIKRLTATRYLIIPTIGSGVEEIGSSAETETGIRGIFDLTGRKVNCNESDLPKGIYIVRDSKGSRKIKI